MGAGGKGSKSKVGSGGKAEVKGKAEDYEEEEARESLVQELLPVADWFQARGAIRALSGGVWAGAHGGDGDTAADVGARACSRGGAGGRDGVRGGQRTCDPGIHERCM